MQSSKFLKSMPKITDMLIGPHGALSQPSVVPSRKPYPSSSSAVPSSSYTFGTTETSPTEISGPPLSLPPWSSSTVSRNYTPSLPLSSVPNDNQYNQLLQRLYGLTITENVLDTLFTKTELYTILARYGFRNILKLHETTKDVFIATCMKLVHLGRIKVPDVTKNTLTTTTTIMVPHSTRQPHLSMGSGQSFTRTSSSNDSFSNGYTDDNTSEHVSPTTQLALEGLLQEVIIEDENDDWMDGIGIMMKRENSKTNDTKQIIRTSTNTGINETVAYTTNGDSVPVPYMDKLTSFSSTVPTERSQTTATSTIIVSPTVQQSSSLPPTAPLSSSLSLLPSVPPLSIALPSRKVSKDKLMKEFENAPVLDDDAYYIDSDEINVTLSSGTDSDNPDQENTTLLSSAVQESAPGTERKNHDTLLPEVSSKTVDASVPNPIDTLKAKLSFATIVTNEANKVLAEAKRSNGTGKGGNVRKGGKGIAVKKKEKENVIAAENGGGRRKRQRTTVEGTDGGNPRVVKTNAKGESAEATMMMVRKDGMEDTVTDRTMNGQSVSTPSSFASRDYGTSFISSSSSTVTNHIPNDHEPATLPASGIPSLSSSSSLSIGNRGTNNSLSSVKRAVYDKEVQTEPVTIVDPPETVVRNANHGTRPFVSYNMGNVSKTTRNEAYRSFDKGYEGDSDVAENGKDHGSRSNIVQNTLTFGTSIGRDEKYRGGTIDDGTNIDTVDGSPTNGASILGIDSEEMTEPGYRSVILGVKKNYFSTDDSSSGTDDGNGNDNENH